MEILRLIIEIIILCIGFYLAFLKSYFSEKGKQLAIKEDIEEITKKVESIKSDFQRENDEIKSKVQHILSIHESHRTEERNVLLDFYRKYNDWLYSLLEINYGNFNRGNIPDLIKTRADIDRHYRITNVAQSLTRLLVKDEDIVSLSNKLTHELLVFKNWIDIRLLKLQQNIESHNSLTNRFLKLIEDFEKNRELAEQSAKKEKELMAERDRLFEEYYDNRNGEYSKIIPLDDEFTKLVKEYLTKD